LLLQAANLQKFINNSYLCQFSSKFNHRILSICQQILMRWRVNSDCREGQRPSTSSTASDSAPGGLGMPRATVDQSSSSSDNATGTQARVPLHVPFSGPALFVQQPSTTTAPQLTVPGPVQPPTVVTSAYTPPPSSPVNTATSTGTGTNTDTPPLTTRKDSTTQVRAIFNVFYNFI